MHVGVSFYDIFQTTIARGPSSSVDCAIRATRYRYTVRVPLHFLVALKITQTRREIRHRIRNPQHSQHHHHHNHRHTSFDHLFFSMDHHQDINTNEEQTLFALLNLQTSHITPSSSTIPDASIQQPEIVVMNHSNNKAACSSDWRRLYL